MIHTRGCLKIVVRKKQVQGPHRPEGISQRVSRGMVRILYDLLDYTFRVHHTLGGIVWLCLYPKADSERKKKDTTLDHISNISESSESRDSVSHSVGMHGWSSATPTATFHGNVDSAIRLDFISRGVRDREKNYLRRFVSAIYCARRPVHHDRTRWWTSRLSQCPSRIAKLRFCETSRK